MNETDYVNNDSKVLRYSLGFTASIVLTIVAYLLVTASPLQGATRIAAIIALAVVQLIVQLTCFLHIGQEASPRHRLFSFIGMFIVLLIVVIGSLWIMSNLDYNMMHRRDDYMMLQRDKGF